MSFFIGYSTLTCRSQMFGGTMPLVCAEPYCREFAFQCGNQGCQCMMAHLDHKTIETEKLLRAVNTDNNSAATDCYSIFCEVIDNMIDKLNKFRNQHQIWFEQYCRMKAVTTPQIKKKILTRDFSDKKLFCGDNISRIIQINPEEKQFNDRPYKVQGKYVIKTDIYNYCQKIIQDLEDKLRSYWKDRTAVVFKDKKLSEQNTLCFDKTLRSYTIINCEPKGRLFSSSWDKILHQIGTKYHLTELNINNCGLTDHDVSTICHQFKYLKILNLQNNEITSKSVSQIIQAYPELQQLNLDNNKIDEQILITVVTELSTLKKLNLKSKKLENIELYPNTALSNCIGDHGCSLLAPNCPYLVELKLRKQKISDEGAKQISNHMKKLKMMDLGKNFITNYGVIQIAWNLIQLTHLYLFQNQIGDEGSQAIAQNLKKLKVLDLRDNTITSQGAVPLTTKLKNLVTLRLANNKIDAKGVKQIAFQLKKPSQLTVSLINNNFTISQCNEWLEQLQQQQISRLQLVSVVLLPK